MRLRFCAASHPGVRRDSNEDSYCVRPDLGLFAVADGVGGHAAGEIASRAALDALEQAMADTRGGTPDSEWPFQFQPALGVDGNRLNWGVHLASRRVRTEAGAARGREGMATTIAAVMIANVDERRDGVRAEWLGPGAPPPETAPATLAHVGDSRIYRWRGGRLDRLTRDHSWVQEQVDAGRLTAFEARRHPRRNLLTRALSGGAAPVTDIGLVPLVPGDRLLLCTDGLNGALRDDEIEAIVGGEYGETPGATACDALVSAANLAGAPDNVTVIVVEIRGS
ncbi:MAG TPA: protein phosphatase 2C domain-containing protein [Vicinamibacterales bacterium]|nr:serine/threonine-protein phosphatase [Gemmatimonadales bacterium]HOC17287.1 protein phosphatase 2C domain-containing protein [Vicinamibacterales bacterium]